MEHGHGPYTGLLNPRKPVQVRANWSSVNYPRFTGQVDSWATNWPDARTQLAILHVTDAFRMLNLADITSGGYPAQVLADGAIAYWRLGDPIGSPRAADSAGTHPGIPDSSVTFGQSGALIANPGTSAQINQTTAAGLFAGISIPPVFGSKSAVTVVAWFNSTGGDLQILFTVTMPCATSPLQFSFNVNSALGLQLVIAGGSNFNQAATVADGNWHQVAITLTSGAAASNQLATAALSLDGSTIRGVANTATGTGGATFNPSDLIGSQSGPSAQFNTQEVAFFPTALSGPTIANEYNLATFPARNARDLRIRRVLNAISWSTRTDASTSAPPPCKQSPRAWRPLPAQCRTSVGRGDRGAPLCHIHRRPGHLPSRPGTPR